MFFATKPQLKRLLSVAPLALLAMTLIQGRAETIYQAKGFAKIPWTQESGKPLSPVFWLELDLDSANRRASVPDFVSNDANTMKLEFVFKSEDQRVRWLKRIGCAGGTERLKIIPFDVALYHLHKGQRVLIQKKREETSFCEGWTRTDVDSIVDTLPNDMIAGEHYALEIEPLEAHPEFKDAGIEVYFTISYSHHSY